MRFFPVTLRLGESTELPFVNTPAKGARTVEVTFSVEQEYAVRWNWWYGSIKKKVEIGKGENPYFAPAQAVDIPDVRPLKEDSEALKTRTPNKAAEPTHTTVMPPAGAGDRASGASGSH